MKTSLAIGRLMVGIVASLFLVTSAFGNQTVPASTQTVRKLDLSIKIRRGDFDQMLKHRVIRVLVPYSRTLYFNDNGREMGISAETIRDFEHWINVKYAKKLRKRPLTVFIIPTTRDKLLPEVAQGRGEIAVGNLTATEGRLKVVDFVTPSALPSVKELVITGPKSPEIASAEDLAGKTVHVRKSSSYYESLNALNAHLKKEGKPAMRLVLVPEALEDEDLMEMLNVGILQVIVVDDWEAEMWSKILPKIKVNKQAILREGGRIGWAIRGKSPKLKAEIEDFFQGYLKKQGVAAYRLKKYMSRVKQIKDPTGGSEWERFEKTLALFKKYGNLYSFDPLMLAAEGYQESRLNQNARSHVGAIGIMQIMPTTGKQLNVGDIRIAEPNIHAGTKYLDSLMTKYFADANFKGNNRTLFAFASYNCGPGNVSKMRKEAAKRGLDPNEWFNNVEIVTAEKIGMETTTYVRNIYKYYAAYRFQLEAQERMRKAREQVSGSSK